jgi:hypothetical protein
MRRTAVIAAVVVSAFTAGYAAGFWAEHRRRIILEDTHTLTRTQMQLQNADARVRGAAVLGLLLTVEDSITAQNYGLARQYATRFFEAARAEQSTPVDTLRDPINAILSQRDHIIAGLAVGNPSVIETLHEVERTLRIGLGYPLPFMSPDASARTGDDPSDTSAEVARTGIRERWSSGERLDSLAGNDRAYFGPSFSAIPLKTSNRPPSIGWRRSLQHGLLIRPRSDTPG